MKVFLYDPGSVNSDTLAMMRKKGYFCVALTNDPAVFWNTIAGLPFGAVLVILSHGDNDGPLAVAGNDGQDIDLDAFANAVHGKQLYLLSCHTGADPCATTLAARGVTFAAPEGEAEFRAVGSDKLYVYSSEAPDSKKGQNIRQARGWKGSLSPGRKGKPLELP